MPAKQVATTDPNQKMMQSMAYTFPLMTVVLGAQFPAGLTLYWIATTAFQIVQQYFVSGWGQLPKYLKFLRNVPTPADKHMKQDSALMLKEARDDMAQMEQRDVAPGDQVEEEGNGAAVVGTAPSRRRGRRRGKR
jgi:membrane protein insertase Oxa1/YidC/SpoIIIJ